MQIVCGGKVSWLHDLLVIRGKTFAIVQQFETPYNRKKKITGKPLRLEANPQKPQKFSTVNDLHYTVASYWMLLVSLLFVAVINLYSFLNSKFKCS